MPIALLVCAALLSADAPKKPAPLASLDRTMCFGSCPAYTVTVFTDGTVKWSGRDYVKEKGDRVSKLSSEQLQQIRDEFTQANYFDLKGKFDCYDATDNPTATTSFTDGNRSRSIVHYYGCRRTPGVEVLSALEKRLDEIIGTEKWIGK
ncbi:MAG: DUF6438 domain-containing protein [Myxococcaceae bacterium]